MPAVRARLGDNVVHVRITCWVFPGFHRIHGALGHVHAPHRKPCIVETDGGWEADVAQANDTDGHVGI